VGVKVKKITEDAKSWIQSFGIIDGGLELMRYAWPSLDYKLSIQRKDMKLLGDDGTTKNHPGPSSISKRPTAATPGRPAHGRARILEDTAT
jgi:hypothetical protein